jgi:hypothetical protein
VESGQTDPVIPELREAELTLEQALAEVCSAKPASRADTGELIKVEEVLEIAGEAAKRAISLRRRRRAERNQRATRWAMGDAEAAATLGATHRAFMDARGIWWDVFAVYPGSRESPQSPFKGTFQQGWLCFDSGTEKRRLSPVPKEWQALGDAELEQLLGRAEAASRRRRPPKDRGPGDRRSPE